MPQEPGALLYVISKHNWTYNKTSKECYFLPYKMSDNNWSFVFSIQDARYSYTILIPHPIILAVRKNVSKIRRSNWRLKKRKIFIQNNVPIYVQSKLLKWFAFVANHKEISHERRIPFKESYWILNVILLNRMSKCFNTTLNFFSKTYYSFTHDLVMDKDTNTMAITFWPLDALVLEYS